MSKQRHSVFLTVGVLVDTSVGASDDEIRTLAVKKVLLLNEQDLIGSCDMEVVSWHPDETETVKNNE